VRRSNSLMPQGGLARSGHTRQTTYAKTTTATAAAIPMRTIRARYPAAQNRAQGPTVVPAYHGTRINTEAILSDRGRC